jgi:hypothetical protein
MVRRLATQPCTIRPVSQGIHMTYRESQRHCGWVTQNAPSA